VRSSFRSSVATRTHPTAARAGRGSSAASEKLAKVLETLEAIRTRVPEIGLARQLGEHRVARSGRRASAHPADTAPRSDRLDDVNRSRILTVLEAQ
jgi:hypothetical protein